MPEVAVSINGQLHKVAAGQSVAAVLMNAGVEAFRTSMHGDARGPLCGMGVCMECRVTIDGVAQQPSCQALVRDGMVITCGGS